MMPGAKDPCIVFSSISRPRSQQGVGTIFGYYPDLNKAGDVDMEECD